MDMPAWGRTTALYLDRSQGLDRLIIRIQGLDVDLDSVLRTVEVVERVQIGKVGLAGNPHRTSPHDLTTGGVPDTSLDFILLILITVGGGFKGEQGPAINICFDLLSANNLSSPTTIVASGQ